MQAMNKKKVLKGICFVIIFVLLFELFTAMFMPKWSFAHTDEMQTRVQAFYKQEKNSHDVIYLGASYVYCGISPLCIWEEQGITGYVFGATRQRAWMSTYYLEEALKYQTPKVVVFEVGAIFDENEASEQNNRKNIDYLRWSPVKLKAIKTICDNTGESKKEYLLPFLRYHSRWSELEAKDFNLKGDTSYHQMGTLAWRTTRPASKKKLKRYESWKDKAEEASVPEVGDRCSEAVLEMKQMCEEKGIEFLMVRVPTLNWSQESVQGVQRFADENGIPYLDMNLCREETGVDWQTDTSDKGKHLNILGCKKASSYLGEYLKENYKFETKLSDTNREFWNESAGKFYADWEAYRKEGAKKAGD